jgi:hypothetical protein
VLARDLASQVSGCATDAAYEAALDAMLSGYRKLCQSMAKRYLDREGSDRVLLTVFREKFMKMLRTTTAVIDEIDYYVEGRYVDKSGKVIKFYMTAPKLRKEIRRFKKKNENE